MWNWKPDGHLQILTGPEPAVIEDHCSFGVLIEIPQGQYARIVQNHPMQHINREVWPSDVIRKFVYHTKSPSMGVIETDA